MAGLDSSKSNECKDMLLEAFQFVQDTLYLNKVTALTFPSDLL